MATHANGQVRLTKKQETFAQALFSGKNQTVALREAYDTSKMCDEAIHVMACRIAKNPKINTRLAELRAPVVEKLQYGFEQAMNEANDALKMATEGKNGGAMVAAVTLRAKLAGLLVEKREVRTGPLEGLPVKELEAIDAAVAAIRKARESV